MKLALPLYRLSLRILPRALRTDFGDDMVQLFRDELGATTRPVARLGLVFAAVADVLRQAAQRPPADTATPPIGGSFLKRLPTSFSNFPHDFGHGLRLVRRYPATAIVAIATLAIGIGANTAIFSVVDAVLLRALPYPHPEQLVVIHESRPLEHVMDNTASPADVADWRATSRSFSAMAGFTGAVMLLSGSGEPAQLQAGLVQSGFFDVLGVQPAIGRSFRREEEVRGKNQVVIVSYGLWRRQFNADPNIVGRVITLTGIPRQVVGVLPEGFTFGDAGIELYAPLAFGPDLPRGSHFVEVFARLRPEITLAQARAEMLGIGKNLEATYPDTNRGHGANVVAMQSDFVAPIRSSLIVLIVAVALVLLLASVNVANLMLVRAAKRDREMAVRAALGADRWRLMTQSFAECLAIAAVGGAFGVALAAVLIRALPVVLPEQLSVVRTETLHLDPRAMAAALVITMATAIVFGVLPAVRASRADVVEPLKQGGRGAASVSRWTRVTIVISEVTLASLTLVGAGLIVRSFTAISSQPLGFDPHGRVVLELTTPDARYPTPPQRSGAMLELERRLSGIPGVTAVGAIDILPLSGDDTRRGVEIEGRASADESPTRMHPRIVTTAYFTATGMTIVRGRAFSDQDTATTPSVSIITEVAADRFWPGQDPVGKRWRLGADQKWSTIVGIARDVRHWGLSQPVNPMVFMPERQAMAGSLTFVAKTGLSAESFASAARAVVHDFDPNLPVGNLRTFDDVVAASLRRVRAVTLLMTTFGALALLLAGIGIYGVMSQLVESRVQEIGVRVALGAKPAHVLSQFLVGCAYQTSAGIVIGATAGVTAMSATGLLFGIRPWDAPTLVIVVATIMAASMSACLVPAWRALRIDPVTAIRG